MTLVRKSTFLEYVRWYLEKDHRKGANSEIEIPTDHAEATVACGKFSGKCESWFPNAEWTIQLLDESEFRGLMVIESHFTKYTTLVRKDIPRTLMTTGDHAREIGYFDVDSSHRNSLPDNLQRILEIDRATDEWKKHQEYYNELDVGTLQITCENRITVRTLNPSEKTRKFSYSWYLHDGFGRSLPYMAQVLRGKQYLPVEAFVATEV